MKSCFDVGQAAMVLEGAGYPTGLGEGNLVPRFSGLCPLSKVPLLADIN